MKTLFTLLILFLAGNTVGMAQAICQLDILSVKNINGRVIVKDTQKVTGVPQARIELSRDDKTNILVSSIETDNDGYFDIKKITKGSYRLSIMVKFFDRFDVFLKVKQSKAISSDKLIFVNLDTNCFNSKAKLIRVKP